MCNEGKCSKNNDHKLNNFLFEKHVDLKTRTIYLMSEIEESSIEMAIKAVSLLEGLGDQSIHVMIGSYGGSVYDGLALYDALRASKCTIHTHCLGKCMSMGLILFLAGDIRHTSPHATFMAHSVSSVTMGNLSSMEVDLEETGRLNAKLVDILVDRTNKDKRFWNKKVKHTDFFFGSNEAVKLGVVNEN